MTHYWNVKGEKAPDGDGEDYVQVTLRMPKRLMDFLKDVELTLRACMHCTVQEYLEEAVLQTVGLDISVMDVFTPAPKVIIEKYDLQEILEGYC